jgi:hypothetical protein
MPLDPAFTFESVADDLDPKMRFAIRVMMMAMPGVMMRLVNDLKKFWRQRRRQFGLDPRPNGRLRLLRHSSSSPNLQEITCRWRLRSASGLS